MRHRQPEGRDDFSPLLGDGRGATRPDRGRHVFRARPLPSGALELGFGQIAEGTHSYGPDCAEHGCPIHHPSEHSLDDLPLSTRSDTPVMERICPHGVGHPDPDSMAWLLRMDPQKNEGIGIHGCDGCCSDEARAARDRIR
jgi:hypothetical protein